jgi:hypothetical protein
VGKREYKFFSQPYKVVTTKERKKTLNWPIDTGQKDKQRSTKHYTENKLLNNTKPHLKRSHYIISLLYA